MKGFPLRNKIVTGIRFLMLLSLVASQMAGAVQPALARGVSIPVDADSFNANFNVWMSWSGVHGYNWPLETVVTLTVDDPETGLSPDVTRTDTSHLASWDGTTYAVEFDLGQALTFKPGFIVSMSGADVTKTITIGTVTAVAHSNTEIVTGTAPANSEILVEAFPAKRHVTADLDGKWQADFSQVGIQDDEQTNVDITASVNVITTIVDADGDKYSQDWFAPGIKTFPQSDRIDTYDWPIDTPLTLNINHPGNEGEWDYTDTAVSITADWDPNRTQAIFNFSGNYDLVAGDIINISSADFDIAYTIPDLQTTLFDEDLDTVSGTSANNARIIDCVHAQNDRVCRTVDADDTGNWIADYHNPGISLDEATTFDIKPGSSGWTTEYDADGATQVDWNISNPRMEANITDDWVHGRDWPTGTLINMRIDSPANGDGWDFSDSATVEPAPWNPNDVNANFAMNGKHDIVAGDKIELSGDGKTITYTVVDIKVTGFDLSADTVSGLAPADNFVYVCANRPTDCLGRSTQAGESGAWQANYHLPGSSQDEQDTFDLKAGSDGWASVNDISGSQTQVNWRVPKPRIELNLRDNWVHARDWPQDSELTLKVDQGPDAGWDYTTTAIVQPQPWDSNEIIANFELSPDNIDLMGGDKIEISGAGKTVTYTAADLQVSTFNTETDTVSGMAPADTEVFVCADVPNNCIGRTITSAPDGSWQVTYDPAEYDLRPGSTGWARVTDLNENQTQTNWRVANPSFDAWYKDGHYSAYDWPVGEHLVMTIDDPASGESPDYTSPESEVIVASWDPNTTVADFNTNGAITVTPGMTVTISGISATKTLIISDPQVTNIDLVNDIVSGTSDPLRDLWMGFNLSCCRSFTADDLGNWSVDYSQPGLNGEPVADLVPGIRATINAKDEDGDNTSVNWDVPNPRINVLLSENRIEGYSWQLGSDVTLTVHENGVSEDFTATQQPQTAEWDPRETVIRFDLPDYTLKPGQVVSMTDNVTTRTHTIQYLTISNVNKITDVVSGSAPAGSSLYIGDICELDVCASRQAEANEQESWTADFATPQASDNQNTTNTSDLRWGVFVPVRINDAEGNNTEVSLTVKPDPYFKIYTDNNLLQAEYWPAMGVTLTMKVKRGGAFVLTTTAVTGPAHWDSNVIAASFNEDGAFVFQPGDIVSVAGGGVTKTLTVDALTIEDVDRSADTIRGSATSGATVTTVLWNNFPLIRTEVAQGDGSWSVDYTDPGAGAHEGFTYKLKDAHWGGEAWIQDEDLDQMAYRFMGDSAYIETMMDANMVRVHGWQLGTDVEILIHDPSNTYEDYTATKTSGRADWDPNELVVDFDMNGILTLHEGMEISVSGSGNTRSTVVFASPQHVVDVDADTVSGVTLPNGYVSVNAWGANARRGINAADDGSWNVNFNQDSPDGNGYADLMPGSHGDTWLYDGDNNATTYQWYVPNEHIDVWPVNDFISAYDWPLGVTLTLTIEDPNTETSPDHTDSVEVVKANWDPMMTIGDFNLKGTFDIQPGMTVSISDGTLTREIVVANLEITSVDTIHDIVSGVADADQPMWAYFEKSCCRTFTSASDGAWSVDYKELGPNGEPVADIGPDDFGTINLNDADGDNTAVDWSAPPQVLEILRQNPNPSNAASVSFRIKFTEPVTGVDNNDFVISKTGLTGTPAVTGIVGENDVYIVTVSTGSGSGTLRLDLADNDSIRDFHNDPLSGEGTGNGSFHSGQTYIIRPPAAFVKKTPVNGAAIASTSVTLTWAASTYATSYEVCYDTSNDNLCSNWVSNGTATTKTLSGLVKNTTFYWQVRAKNATTTPIYANGAANAFWSFRTDSLPPRVTSITLLDPNPSTAASLRFTVNFSEIVTGADVADFSLTLSGVTGARVSAVTGTGNTRIVTITTGSGVGTIQLKLIDNDTIKDTLGMPLGGVGAGNGSFLSGPKYTLDRNNQITSTSTQDGWILESAENSSIGGTLNSLSLMVGDDALNKQYRSLLSFNTASLPDNAVIVRVTLKIKKTGGTAANPFTTHGALLADMRKGFFGTSDAMLATDFQAAASSAAGSFTDAGSGWYQLVLTSGNFANVNKLGLTQFRLRFTKDDDNDRASDYAIFGAGEAATGSKPVLVVEYTLP